MRQSQDVFEIQVHLFRIKVAGEASKMNGQTLDRKAVGLHCSSEPWKYYYFLQIKTAKKKDETKEGRGNFNSVSAEEPQRNARQRLARGVNLDDVSPEAWLTQCVGLVFFFRIG